LTTPWSASITNALTRVTAFEYDPANRLNKITYPTNKVVQFGYDLAGRRTSVTDERNFTTNFAYDNAYRLITVTDPLTHMVNYGYDLMSNLVAQTDGEGNVTNYEYDTFDRLTKTIYPVPDTGVARLEERFEYDAVGNLKKRIDTANRQTQYNYDNAYRLTNSVDALNQVTQFQYNPRSQMVKVIDAKGQNYDFTYDPLGRQLTQTRDGATMTYQYDLVGNRTRRTDYKGDLTRYTYDPLNRLKRIIYPNTAENVQYNYDKLSRLQKAIDETGTVDFNYTQRDQVSSVLDVHGQKVGYSYDAAGNRRFLRLNDVDQFDHRSDSANRLQKIIDKQNSDATIDFNYDSANRMTRVIRPNGVDTVYRYDGMSRLTVLRDFTVAAPTPAINHRALSYNQASQISNITNKQDNRTFNYDNIDRLTGVTGSATENYAYDQVGNRTSSHQSATYTTTGFNKLTATANATYTYDANGNMTSKVDTAGTWVYEWDFENRLKKVTRPDGQNVVYRYDGLGRRVERLPSNGISTKFIYDGLNVFADQNSDGSSVKYINTLSIDNKMGQIVNGNTQYVLRDHLGSTNNIVDSAGASLESTAYDAFGKATTNLSTRYQFTGRESDDFSGLQFSRNRWYSSEVGRFISEDPIGFGGGDANLYGYVRNQPLIYRDSEGLYPGNDVLTTVLNSPEVQEGFTFAAQAFRDPTTRTALATTTAGGATAAKASGSAALAYGATSVGAASTATVGAVVVGGFGAGYLIGYYPGQWLAQYNYPDQFPTSKPPRNTKPKEGCGDPNERDCIVDLSSRVGKPETVNIKSRADSSPRYCKLTCSDGKSCWVDAASSVCPVGRTVKIPFGVDYVGNR